jgi:hypothetical protein
MKMPFVLYAKGTRAGVYVSKNSAFHPSSAWFGTPTPFQVKVVLDRQFVPQYFFL